MTKKVGILLTNLGTPDAPTPAALRRYLGEFLADPRVTELSRWLWLPILHGIILRTRPKRSAQLYQKIWTKSGSPLFAISQAQVAALREILSESVVLALGMRYGHPSIAEGLAQLRHAQVQRITILPLYPQYSSATTGSTFDAISQALQQWRWIPDIHFISDYHNHPAYIHAVATRIQAYWQTHGQPTQLIFSFHGTPKRFFLAGDPYYHQCLATAQLIATQLALPKELWQVTFQSRFGREEWLQPYTDYTLTELGKKGTQRVDVVCPGFAADCLETLEEIDQENRHLFLEAGGKVFHYIPALNECAEHIAALKA
ncbi:MAG: ferrochelatase [Beggiatoa sp. IS2]|nr:MAG: ferrochelatase [Beggiatoa sp. IS2]